MSLLGITSLCISIIQGGNEDQEYMKSIYIMTTATGILLSFASTIFIKQKLFSFIKVCDVIVNESKLNFNHLNMKKGTVHVSNFKTTKK